MLINERTALLENMEKYNPARAEICSKICKHKIDPSQSYEDCPDSCKMKNIRKYVSVMETTITLHCLEGKSENVKPTPRYTGRNREEVMTGAFREE